MFQKNKISNNNGAAITAPSNKAVLVNFNFFIKNKLNTAKRIISQEHGFLKIIVTANKNKKTLNYFTEVLFGNIHSIKQNKLKEKLLFYDELQYLNLVQKYLEQ